ncbi:hypothetical protein B5807_01812 [Epicoccum nigrum]|uniref:Uncharacterized protein n=1 Tax=Epicoccum nigrum TaxID=105696 RepID=A0A1Y2MH13_EPING|nr:hypothetical protein B5807_01812 [Epicoccum nigrum]
MHRLELCVVGSGALPLEVHLAEHVEGALLPRLGHAGAALGLERALEEPALGSALQAVGLAVVAGGDDLILAAPDERGEGEHLGADADDGGGGLVWGGGVDDSEGRVVRGEGQGVARGGEGDAVDPAGGVVEELAADGVEGEALAPGGGLGAGVDALDEAGEHAGVAVGRAGGQQHAVGVPGDGGDGAADGLLDVLADPPVVLFLEIAHGDEAGAAADGELCLRGRPAHARGRAVDAQQDERGLPPRGRRLPHVRVAVLRARHDLAAVGRNVHARDRLVVARQLILQLEAVAGAPVEVDDVLARHCQRGAVRAERVVRDGVVEEVVHFGGGHCN